MIKSYFKQAWTLIKQNVLFTSIYVIGTGLSIALIMTIFIIFYVKFCPIYPEYNRNRTLVLKHMNSKVKENGSSTGSQVAYYVGKEMLKGLPHLDKIGTTMDSEYEKNVINLPLKKEPVEVKLLSTDQGFWDVFTFRFLSGMPFSQEDVEAKAPVAVISQSLAHLIFASDDVLDKSFVLNGNEIKVCGVVEDVSEATPATAADLWMPLTYGGKYLGSRERLTGNARVYMTAHTIADKDALREEVRDVFRKYNLTEEKYECDIMEQPDDYWLSTFRVKNSEAPQAAETLKYLIYILLAMLFIPAMNLSGMITSRMGQRFCELGVRKVYGATNSMLLKQVLWENLLLTCIGGLLGLLISYLIVITANDWILTIFDNGGGNSARVPFLTMEMLFNPLVFCSVFILCVLLNLISALIPTILSLRNTIVQSLNSNR